MEDDHLHLLGLPDAPDISLFGVYDGHGGDFVAHYAARKFPEHLLRAATLRSSDSNFASTASKAFEVALMSIDAELLRQPEIESGQDQSGSTSVMTLIGPKDIVCANTGDSRAVLSRGGEAVPLSHDHKPMNPEEKARIEAAGGTVKFNRVNGDLAVSRALGDFVYKRCETVNATAQAVTAFPEVCLLWAPNCSALEPRWHGRPYASPPNAPLLQMIVETRDPEKDEFVVLACDGIWDVMSSQAVVDKVRDLLLNGRPPAPPPPLQGQHPNGAAAVPPPPQEKRPWDLGAVCEELIDHCFVLGSRDNMSVVVVILNPAFKPKLEAAS